MRKPHRGRESFLIGLLQSRDIITDIFSRLSQEYATRLLSSADRDSLRDCISSITRVNLPPFLLISWRRPMKLMESLPFHLTSTPVAAMLIPLMPSNSLQVLLREL
jgi:hypothetical protein